MEAIRSDISEKDKKLVELVLDYKERYAQRRWIFEREWYRNILMYVGQQWITYEEGHKRWRKRNLPSWVPMPVTNRLSSTINTIRSSVAQVDPAFVAYPTRDNESSILSAAAADKYLEVIKQESGFRAAKRRLASWITMTGNGFLLTEFDTSAETGTVFIPGEQCQDCGTQMTPDQLTEQINCIECGSANLAELPDLGIEIPQGKIRVSARSPFEVYVDNNIQELEDMPAVLLVESRGLEDVKALYGKAADEVTSDTNKDTGRFYLDSISHVTGTGFGPGNSMGGTNEDKTGPVTLNRLYVKRCKDYPEGAYIVMTGDQHIVEVKEPYPFFYKGTKRKFFPIVHVRYDDVPGRFWAKTPIDDLTFKQRQRNELESLFQTIVMRCANPVWLLPTNVQASPITGDPGLMIRYTASGGSKPERLPGVDAPTSLINFLQQIDQDFEELANTFAVMKGKSPGNVRAASAIQMLLERGFGRYGSVFDNLEEAYEQWAIQALELWRQKAVFPRVQAIARAAGSWQFMEFMGSDIGEVDIRVEAGSTRPRSQAGRQMLIGQALQWGLLNVNDPEQKMKIFEQLGMADILPGAEADVKVVAEENAKFMAWAQSIAKVMGEAGQELEDEVVMQLLASSPLKGNVILDHHPTHMAHHRRLGISDAFRALPESIQNIFVQHIMAEHMMPAMAEQATGMGITGLAAQIGAVQQPGGGTSGQSTSAATGKQPQTGKGPGGAQSPFGNEGAKQGAGQGSDAGGSGE